MKKLSTLIVICIAVASLLSSCSSGFVHKRRYTKGYYVSHSHKAQATKAIASSNTATAPLKVNPVTSDEAATTNVNGTAATVNNNAAVQNTKPLTASAQPRKASHNAKAAVFANKLVEQPLLQKQFKRIDSKVNAAKPYASDGDALSLFWIVILVILILWVLGLIAGGWGLGGLINLLLVIALILLILWLLRIL